MATKPTKKTTRKAATKKTPTRRSAPKPEAVAEKITVSLPPRVVEKARRVVFWSPGETVGSLVAAALDAEIERREKKRGEPFPKRPGPIRTGRPVRG